MQILASKTSISHRSKSQENKCRLSLLPLLRLPQKIALNCQTYGSNTWMWAFLKWRAKKIMPEKLKSTLFVLTKNISFLSQSFGWKGILKSKYWWGMGNMNNISSADNGEDIGMFVFGIILKYSGEFFLKIINCWISQNLFRFFLRFLGCGIKA